jgi:uroporphyrin-III C-methyltransferase
MADGLAPSMPVAVIENAARPEMRVLRGLLAGLPDLVEREAVQSPALIVIGEVTARLHRHPDESQDRSEVSALLAAIPGQARDDGRLIGEIAP